MKKTTNGKYFTLNDYAIEKYGKKIIKLCINAGFSCPNRKNGKDGCLFCTDKGIGDMAEKPNLSITKQLENQRGKSDEKYNDGVYFAYFQSFTNTYKPVEELEKIYYEALNFPDISGISIATRPDELNGDILKLLKKINDNCEVWVEMGLQTSNEKSAKFLNIGYKRELFLKKALELRDAGIKVIAHIIVGLPFEDENDNIETIKFLNKCKVWGVKIHSFYIQKNSPIYAYYKKSPFAVLEKDEYTSVVVSLMERLNPEIIIHRITGDADKSLIFLPEWSCDKLSVIGEIHKKLKERNSFQGKYYEII